MTKWVWLTQLKTKMSIHEPSRGGTRGGKDQFTWKDVEVDKHRENYLANSLMAPVGRWQKGKDLTWYTKDSKVLGKKERLKLEMAAVKKVEEEAMARALGLKSGSTMKPTEVLSKEEIAEICKRKDDDVELTHDRMKGVGYKSQKNMMLISNATSNDGVTKFEQDPLDGNNLTRLVLRTSSSDTHRRPVSTSSDHHQQQQPEQHSTNKDNQKDDDGVWVTTTTVSNKKKSKKRKKAKKETKNHSRHEDSEKHGKCRKSDKIRKIKKRKDKYSNNSSNSSSSSSIDDSDNNRHVKAKRRTDMSERKRERQIKERKRESSESSYDKERTIRKSYHDRGDETISKRCKKETRDMRRSNDYGKERRYQERDRTHHSPGQREYGRQRKRERDHSPEQKRSRPRHDTDSSN